MRTETTVSSRGLLAGVLVLLRVVDFEEIMRNAENGSVSVDTLKNGGTFTVRHSPKKGEQTEYPVPSAEAGEAFMDGFSAADSARKRGGRKSTAPELPENVTEETDFSVFTKPQICELAKRYDVDFKPSMKKAEIADAIVTRLAADAKSAKGGKRGK